MKAESAIVYLHKVNLKKKYTRPLWKLCCCYKGGLFSKEDTVTFVYLTLDQESPELQSKFQFWSSESHNCHSDLTKIKNKNEIQHEEALCIMKALTREIMLLLVEW